MITLKKAMLLVGLVMPSIGFAQNYSIDWHKIAGGGGTSSGGPYSVNGTIGQPDAGGAMAGGNYSLTGGFWSLISVQTPGAPASGGQLLTFDDLSTSCYDPITNGYAGFNWTNVWVAYSACLGDGYVNGTVSSPNVAFNGYGLDASFNVVSGTFSLISAYVTAVTGSSSITVEGYNGSTLVYTNAYPVNGTTPTFITFDYYNITEVYITGGKFALDNITVNPTVAGKSLTIVPFGPNFVLTWPTNFAGSTLQSTTNLASPVWTTTSLGSFIVNGQYAVTNPISGTQQFFRLSQ